MKNRWMIPMLIANLEYISHEENENELKIYMQTQNTYGQFNVRYRYVFIFEAVDGQLLRYKKCVDDFATEKMNRNNINNATNVINQLLQKMPNDARNNY